MNRTELQPSLFPELNEFEPKDIVVNVASVPQRSPFRYPGGKTWLIPTARKWFSSASQNAELIEPFAGGGIISLTAAAEHYFNHITMAELDEDVAAVWQTIFSDNDYTWLTDRILKFVVSPDNIREAESHADEGIKERAFSTIVRNRTNHGGILAKGSGKIKTGEAGKGLSSRWYPETLAKRIVEANKLRDKIQFINEDAFKIMKLKQNISNTYFFIDPPYTVAGKRLYNLFDVNHRQIFEIVSKMKGHFLLTYDNTKEIRNLTNEFKLPYRTIPMQTTHLIKKEELLISDNFDWLEKKDINFQYA
ncbi:MAG: DNA adenine methylase [Lachnospiraceae bacterium]|nr:DNA adenine methylase [Lachnospiraceae bacterium]